MSVMYRPSFKHCEPGQSHLLFRRLCFILLALAAFSDNISRVQAQATSSPTQQPETKRRFTWEILPPVMWPVRGNTPQRLNPPLFYPSDDNATEAKLKLRLTNNTSQPLTLNRSALGVASEPLQMKPEEVIVAEYTYTFAPGSSQVLNPFEITLSDGVTTEVAKAAFVALKKGEAVVFTYDVDQDGFDDYVLENERLRLMVSPQLGARAFGLIDKRTGVNAFASEGALGDKFVELDPADAVRRKEGMEGTFNRPYAAEILAAKGMRAGLRLSHYAADAYPNGARIERFITLEGGAEHFTVDYLATPKTPDGVQALLSANALVIGDPLLQTRRWLAADGEFAFAATKTKALDINSGWVAAPINPNATLAVLWRSGEVQAVEVEMKESSSFVNLKFKPFVRSEPHAYRVAFGLGAWTPARLQTERARILGR
jgi:hypothetical protein